jgi:peptidoglycan DL-endopeptidase CwlO
VAAASAPAPAVSSRSGIAISAAMAQQGVPYRFAASSPGVAFDCSGLTAYAWAQAGVFLPHQSRQQYAAVPHVSQGEAQPGDLLFYYSPISHVGIYLGGGQLVHAPNTGSTVKVAAVNWGKVTGVGRPG